MIQPDVFSDNDGVGYYPARTVGAATVRFGPSDGVHPTPATSDASTVLLTVHSTSPGGGTPKRFLITVTELGEEPELT